MTKNAILVILGLNRRNTEVRFSFVSSARQPYPSWADETIFLVRRSHPETNQRSHYA